MIFKNKNNKGFTLIELLVVVAIIGLLSSVVLASLNTARGKARDAGREHDLGQIRLALNLYFDKYGNWMQSGSGCGHSGNGNGWFNYVGGSYPKSMGQCLVDEGLTGGEIIDPTGGKTSKPGTGFTYMKYSCGSPTTTYVYAKLEGVAQSATATDGTCCSVCDSSYGMNYYIPVQ
jgi:prepilin-type N-terminal cleavage/methylation domain-containing protein